MTIHSPAQPALTRLLATRTSEVIESLTALLGERVSSLGSDEVEREWVRASVQTNVELLLQVMAHPDDLTLVEPPLGAIALVRRIAQRDVPFYEIVRGYHLAEWYWVRICTREMAELTDDTAELVARSSEVGELVHSYIDRVCGRLSAVYEAERERWRSQEESARIGSVIAVLEGSGEGSADEVAQAEAALGYRLRQRHLGVIMWCGGLDGSGEEFARIKGAAAALARSVGSRGRPLVVARDHTTLWVWLPLEGEGRLDVADVVEVLSAEGSHVRVAFGEPASGLDGFIASHRQAAAAHEVGLAAGEDVGPVFPYREVSSLAFLCADIPRARAWVAETLGALAAGGRREDELRWTLGVYAASSRSATATARALNCHKNTIQYRIRSAERLLGRRVDDCGLDLDLALLACRWLGELVTRPRSAPG
ncbi:MAG TPA: helix-turn-helix domain-containing protein [Pseudonocardia sp.]|nr:helix-turn-helix domain-containing protein [Pseudonocardia sp.]